jgi:hypothetical protein
MSAGTDRSMFLTEDEIGTLTGRKQHKTQRTVLNHLGIQHKVRPDGSLVVLRSHVEDALGRESKHNKVKPQPNWTAI